MRTLKIDLLSVVLVLVGVIIFCPPSVFALPLVSIQPSASTPGVGSFFDVFVDIASVTDLYAFQFDIAFDPAVLSAAGVTEGAFLPGGGSTFFIPGSIDNTAGTISITADSLLGAIPGVSGDGILAVLNFQALALGTSAVSLSNVMLLDSAFADILHETTDGTATPTANPIPEPCTMLLVGSGLLSVVGLRRKCKR